MILQNLYNHEIENRRRRRLHILFSFVIILLPAFIVTCEKPVPVKPAIKSQTQTRLEKILPEPVAKAISTHAKKWPLTLGAICYAETGGENVKGDGGESIGLFQQQPKHWGDVSEHDIEQQIRKADETFNYLVQRYGYRKAVQYWNGGNSNSIESRRYQKRVLALVEEL